MLSTLGVLFSRPAKKPVVLVVLYAFVDCFATGRGRVLALAGRGPGGALKQVVQGHMAELGMVLCRKWEVVKVLEWKRGLQGE